MPGGGDVRVIALEYHDVVPDGRWSESGFSGQAAATYKMSVERFSTHLDAVGETGAPICSDVRGLPATGPTPVVWTFDDGGEGYALHAADLLEARGWRGHVFMTTQQIGQPRFLNGTQLRDLHSRGHVVGTHSRTHPVRMSALSATEVAEEWRSSLEELGAVLGARVTVGSVPGGFHSTVVASMAAEQGIEFLFTSEPVIRVHHVQGCAVAGRFTLRQDHPAPYAARLVGSPRSRAFQWCQWNAKKVAKSLAGKAYGRIRNRILER